MITTEQLFDGSPRDMTPERVRARYEQACQMIADLCKPRAHPEHRDWTMSIPARPDYDPDLVISDSLEDIPKLLERVGAAEARAERAEAELARLRPVVEAARVYYQTTEWHDDACERYLAGDMTYEAYQKVRTELKIAVKRLNDRVAEFLAAEQASGREGPR